MTKSEVFEKLESLYEQSKKEGIKPEELFRIIIDFFANRVRRTNECLLIKAPFPFENYCFYCRRDCILAGKRITRRVS